jgi:hypothetical protein
MNRFKGLIAVTGLGALLALAVACGSNDAAAASPSANTGSPAGAVTERSSSLAVGSAPQLQAAGSQAGIWVSGEGTVTLEPDLAVLTIGVETSAKTVAAARDEAASAMDSVVDALGDRGIEGADIQTRFFNISPQYDYIEVVKDGRRSGQQVLVGYRVNNSSTVKIRDLDAVGAIIDEVTTAGGDAIRINGISFTVEDPDPYSAQLREQAVADALAKAQHFAQLTGVSLGGLAFISEAGGGAPIVSGDFAVERTMAASVPMAKTSISGGELELRMTVQAAFGIQ